MSQAEEITLIACPESFEVYRTQSLALEPYSLENSGSSGEILSVRPSLETDKQTHLTYLQYGNRVQTLYYDETYGTGLN